MRGETLENLQMFLPEMYPGLTILGSAQDLVSKKRNEFWRLLSGSWPGISKQKRATSQTADSEGGVCRT